ncbi:hypothetical protein V2J09_002687 [Rumex salicifolius]
MIPAAKEGGADDSGCSNFSASADAGASSECISVVLVEFVNLVLRKSNSVECVRLGDRVCEMQSSSTSNNTTDQDNATYDLSHLIPSLPEFPWFAFCLVFALLCFIQPQERKADSWGLALFTGAAGMGFDQSKNREIGEQSRAATEENDGVKGDRDLERLGRQMSEASLCATEEEEEEEVEDGKKFDLGPQYTIKEQLEKDKDDESLRRWKEQLLGSVDLNNVGESLEPEVKISLAILSPGRPDLLLPVPAGGKPKGPWFTLKEGSRYRLKFTFQVCGNIVSGLKYTNSVWKAGVKVYSTKEMLGTFSPQDEPYVYEMPEETTPSGIFVRGSYSSRSKFVDDDNKCYLEINYTFDIRKEWATP